MQAHNRHARRLPVEVVLVWLVFVVVTAEIVVTYWRLPARELYRVSGTGVVGGLSRALVFVNFPVALVALAILAFVYPALRDRRWQALAVFAGALCATVPVVVRPSNLDARPVNALPAIGVLLAVVLTAVAVKRNGLSRKPWQGTDAVRLVIAVVLLVFAVPWVAADLGFFSSGVPLLGHLLQSKQYLPERPGLPNFVPAVHHGHHHGMDGFLLVLTALLLSRRLGRRPLVAGYLALMFCYGIANYANDFWIEQVVKRGWTTWEIPDVTLPKLSVAWSLIVIAAVLLWALWVRLVDWSGDEESPLRPEPDGLPARR